MQFCREKLLIHKLTPPPHPHPPYRGCASHRKDKRNSLKGGDSERLSLSCAEIGSHVCEQRYQLCQRWKNVSQCAPSSTPSHCQPPPPTPAPTHPIPNPSIARFICVSHYRKWNVVPARCINSKVGKLACCTHDRSAVEVKAKKRQRGQATVQHV